MSMQLPEPRIKYCNINTRRKVYLSVLSTLPGSQG
jgi:hypothetical protein